MRRTFPFIIMISFLSTGCVTTYSPYFTKNYEIGEAKLATVGSTMVEWSYGNRNDQTESKDGVRKELIFCGKAKNALEIRYREYDEGTFYAVARQPFYLDLKYDVMTPSTISFQDMNIRIDSADQNKILFTVVKGPNIVESSDNSGKVGLFFSADGTIIKVTIDMAAERAGIRVGDRILEINGKPIPVRDHDGILSMLSGKPNTEIELKLKRDNEILTFKVVRQKY